MDYTVTAFVISGKIRYPYTVLTTPVGWMFLLQLTVLSRCVINVFGGVLVLSFFNLLLV